MGPKCHHIYIYRIDTQMRSGVFRMHACMLSHFSCVRLIVILWRVACQAPLSVGFSRQEYWNGMIINIVY